MAQRLRERIAAPPPTVSLPETPVRALQDQRIDALRAEDRSRGGVPLPAHAQTTRGPQHALSAVRVYPDAHSADALGAQAYTHGAEIFFGRDRFAPASGTGRELLGHELVHVAQQRGGTSSADAAEREAQQLGAAALGGGLAVHHAVVPGVQMAPLSHMELYSRKVKILERMKQPDVPADEMQRLQTELAGIEKALKGGDLDPTSYEGAGSILSTATQLLHVDNMNGRWGPWDFPPVPPAYGVMLWDFYKARAGLEFVGGKRVEIVGQARRDRLNAGLQTARPLIARLEAGGAHGWLNNNFWKFYRFVEEETYFDDARKLVDDSVKGPAAEGAQNVPKIVGKDEELRGMAITGRQALSTLVQIVTRFNSTQMEAELAKVMANIDKGAVGQAAYKGVDTMKFTQAAFYLRGVLNTIDSILIITDLNDREKAAKRHPNLFATVTDLHWQITRLLEGAVVLTSGLTAAVARVAGMADDAALALQLGSRALRVVGTIGATFQALYGISVLLDPDATAEQRRGALFNIGLGAAGAGSLPTLWGGARLWASGPWTVAVLWGGLVYQYQKALTNGMKQGWLTFAIRYAFESLQIRAERVSDATKLLAVALFHLKHLPPPSGDHPEASLYAGMHSVVRIEANNVRDQMERLIDLTTKRSDWFLEREPGDFAAFKKRFLPLKDALAKAKTPEDLLAMSLSSLEVIRTAFQEADAIFTEELKRSLR